MRRVLFAVLVLVLPAVLTAGTARAADAGEVVVYSWSEYIPQDVLDDFTKETGIKVVYSTFESNEAMYAKIKLMQGKGYDVVVPSSYFIEQMRREQLLAPLDKSKLPNLAGIDPKTLNQSYDPGNTYSVPYMWGTVGIGYNTKYIPAGTIKGWKDLLRPEFKGKVILTDDLRDAFGIALKATGGSPNSANEDDIKKAFDFLKTLKESVRIFDVTAIKQALIGEEVWIGPIWNGDFLVAKEESPDLAFVFPEEGALLWVDGFAIPKGAAHKESAHAFINFMLRPDVAARCVEEYKYSTPNLKALPLLPAAMRDDPVLNPGEKELHNAEYVGALGQAVQIYEKYWEALKTSR